LRDRILLMRKFRGADVYPLVTLADTFMPTRYGGRQRPHLPIKGWMRIGGGSVEPISTEPRPQLTPPAAAAEPPTPTAPATPAASPASTAAATPAASSQQAPTQEPVSEPTLEELMDDKVRF
jgi:hypothetical protein